MIRYNVGFDPVKRRFVWLDKAEQPEALDPRFADKYVLSPTNYANRLLAELVGEQLWTTNCRPSSVLRMVASARRLIIVNRGETPVRLRCPFEEATGEALTADGLAACLPGSCRTMFLAVNAENGHTIVDIPGYSLAAVSRG